MAPPKTKELSSRLRALQGDVAAFSAKEILDRRLRTLEGFIRTPDNMEAVWNTVSGAAGEKEAKEAFSGAVDILEEFGMGSISAVLAAIDEGTKIDWERHERERREIEGEDMSAFLPKDAPAIKESVTALCRQLEASLTSYRTRLHKLHSGNMDPEPKAVQDLIADRDKQIAGILDQAKALMIKHGNRAFTALQKAFLEVGKAHQKALVEPKNDLPMLIQSKEDVVEQVRAQKEEALKQIDEKLAEICSLRNVGWRPRRDWRLLWRRGICYARDCERRRSRIGWR